MNKCYFCRTGDLKKKKEVIALNDVPALVCDQCGEKYFNAKVSHKIDKRIQDALKKRSSYQAIDVPVVQF